MHVSIHVIVTGVLCNRAQVRFLLSLFGIFTLKIEKKNPTFMNISWAEMSRNLEISSKCRVEAIKNPMLCKLHKVYKGFRPMGSNAPVWTASFTLVDQWLALGSPGGFRQTLLQVQSPKKIFFILTFRQGGKRARCEHCNLAFTHFLFEIFALFETNFAGRKTWNFYSGGKKMRNASGHQGKNERQRQKANRNTRIF